MMNRTFAFRQPTAATESWWLTVDRACMTQAAREQQDRMSAGRMASFVSPFPRPYIDKRRTTDQSNVSEGRSVLAMAGHEASEQGIEESRPPSSVAVRL
jgi:hypothetical protein